MTEESKNDSAQLSHSFDIVFDKLAEAVAEQNLDEMVNMEEIKEANETILLFKDFQQTISESHTFIINS